MQFSGKRAMEEAGEKQAFLDLYQHYKRLVLAKAVAYTGEPQAGEDVAQEAWLRLLRRISTLWGMPEGAQVNYILFTVRSAAFDWRRKRERDRRIEEEYDAREWASAFPGAEEEFLSHLPEYHLADIWDRLSEADRLLLEGRYLYQMDDAALSELLGCKRASVRGLLSRARRRARDLLLGERRGAK